MSQLISQAEIESNFPAPFCIKALNGLEDVHPNLRGPSASFILPIQMLISSGNIFTDPEIMFK